LGQSDLRVTWGATATPDTLHPAGRWTTTTITTTTTPPSSVPYDDDERPLSDRLTASLTTHLDARARTSLSPLPRGRRARRTRSAISPNHPTTASDANPANANAGRYPSDATRDVVSYPYEPVRLIFKYNPSSNSGYIQNSLSALNDLLPRPRAA
jgi:hypothetical protein